MVVRSHCRREATAPTGSPPATARTMRACWTWNQQRRRWRATASRIGMSASASFRGRGLRPRTEPPPTPDQGHAPSIPATAICCMTSVQAHYGWLFYRRVKTGKAFHRPMNRAVQAHVRSIMPPDPRPDSPVFVGGGARPNARFQYLCDLAGIEPRANVETGKPEPWELKDLRKTCATYYDAHVPESSVEILGHSVGGITHRHYAHRGRLAFQSDHDPTAANSVFRTGSRIRWRVP